MQSENRGLTSSEAAKRLEQYGSNTLKSGKRIHPLTIFFSQFKDVLIIILLAATIISFIMGETTEAIAIIVIVMVNAFLGFIQEYRTEKTIEALRNMAAPTCRVTRDGEIKEIPSSSLVPGDHILLDSGDRVPADAKLLTAYSMKVDEAILTGESVPVDKSSSKNGSAGNVHMGTIITSGRGDAIVTATGMNTEMGKIAGMLGEIKESQTPLQKRLNQLGKFLAIGCLAICAIVAITGVIKGENILDMLIVGISLAVAAVPEGLPAIVTISLALAVSRMVKRKALIRKLHAVETLGCASVICSDKTGTLTENRMTVRQIYSGDKIYDISGEGYESKGSFSISGKKSDPLANQSAKMSLIIAAVCNNSEIKPQGGKISVYGDPTELALLAVSRKSGIDISGVRRTGEIPFDSDRKRMSVTVSMSGKGYIFTKGAPDVILSLCTKISTSSGIVPLTPEIRSRILSHNEKMGAAALRVIGTAYKEKGASESSENAEYNLIFTGLFGMIDPPRKAAYKAVKTCKAAGIKPVMITGDHKLTAMAIAKDLKIYKDGDYVYTGQELDAMDDASLARAVRKASVFARVSPRHKLRIVRAFQKNGHIVAMTGDGVNDAPAVKEADIGVSMGITGTDVTKEAAGVILLDDNFATLIAAVEEGRVIYRNIRKFIRYLLSCNVGEVLTMFVGMLLGFPVVLLPIQILWVNLATDGLPAIALGLDPPDDDVMQHPPRRADEGVFSGGLLFKIIFRGILIAACTLCTFWVIQISGGSLEASRTGAFMTLVLTQLIHVFECKSEEHSIFKIHLLNNKALILAVLSSLILLLSVIYIPFLSGVFSTSPLSLNQLIYVVLITLICPIAGAIVNRK